MPNAFFTRWLPRLLSFGVWALAAASLGYWVLRWDSQVPGVAPVAPSAATVPAVDTAAVAGLLGNPGAAAAVVASASSRFALTGVVARSASRTGAALIAVDGKPPRAFSVGSRVEEGLFLQSVAARSASLGSSADGQSSLTLELPTASPGLILNSGVVLKDAAQKAVQNAVQAAAPSAPARRVRTARTGDTQD